MAITTAVTRKLSNNCVQVDVDNPTDVVRYFRVPENNADSFQKEYVKTSKNSNTLSSVITFSTVFATLALALSFTKQMASRALRYGICAAATLITGTLGIIAGDKITHKNRENLLKKYNAKEIYYENNKLII